MQLSNNEKNKRFMDFVFPNNNSEYPKNYRKMSVNYMHSGLLYISSSVFVALSDIMLTLKYGQMPAKTGPFINVTGLDGISYFMAAAAEILFIYGSTKIANSMIFKRKYECKNEDSIPVNVEKIKSSRKIKSIERADMLTESFQSHSERFADAKSTLKKAARLYHKGGAHDMERETYLKLGHIAYGLGNKRMSLKYLKRSGTKGISEADSIRNPKKSTI